MPAAAVIPAPIAYIKVVAVKKLVVEFQSRVARSAVWCDLVRASLRRKATFTVRKLECSKQALAWIH